MAVFTHHPSAIFYPSKTDSIAVSIKLETASNLFLWLLNRPHDATAIQQSAYNKNFNRLYSGPSEMWQCLKTEERLNRVLSINEYKQAFLGWAKAILGDKFSILFQNQQSIVKACAEELKSTSVTRKRKCDSEHDRVQAAKKLQIEDTSHENNSLASTKLRTDGQATMTVSTNPIVTRISRDEILA